MKQLGDILLEGGLVTSAQLQSAYDEHQKAGRALGRVLVDQGVLTESQLVAALAQQIGMRFVELGDFPVDPSAVSLVPGPLARRYVVLPFGFEDGKLLLAMADPANFLAIEDVRAVTQIEVKPSRQFLASRSHLFDDWIKKHHPPPTIPVEYKSLDIENLVAHKFAAPA